jgi:preprotein translocase subunit YajC
MHSDHETLKMTFKKGDKVRTEDGHAGEILFVDKDGQEAQVALERISIKLRTDSLRKFEANDALAPATAAAGTGRRTAKVARARRAPRA